MVRSLNMLVWELLELYRASHKVTDSYEERLFYAWVQATRAKLIKQRLDAHMRIPDEHWVQDLGYIELEPVDSSAYPTIASGKYILRTVKDIPWTIHSKGEPGGFTRIAPADNLEEDFRLVSYKTALTSGNGKFNKSQIYVALDGQKLCLFSKDRLHKQLKYIRVKGIFENPIEAYEFKNGIEYDWDLEFPISDSLVNDMKNIIVQENFRLIMVPMDDKESNSIDNVANPAPEADTQSVQNPMNRR